MTLTPLETVFVFVGLCFAVAAISTYHLLSAKERRKYLPDYVIHWIGATIVLGGLFK